MKKEMNSNLATTSFTYKDLLLKKLYYSVVCSVVSQLILLQIYVFVSNASFHPIQWMLKTLRTFTSLSTWLFIIPFLSIIFAQSVICAKDYVFRSNYCSTRFQKFFSTFSMHNLVLLVLHVLAGPVLIWLFLSLGGGDFQNIILITNKVRSLNGGSFYLILSGFWTGFYYFVKIYISEKHLSFPVIQQRKWLHFKAQLFPLIKESFALSVWPTLYFIIIYSLWGDVFSGSFRTVLGLSGEDKNYGIYIYFYLWCFSAIYYFNMTLMKFFFNLFLTELVEFPLYSVSHNCLNIQDSLLMSDLPIVQNLACLDLFTLAQWSVQRRQVFFTLSQPGGHPHNWNALVENILKLFNEYIELLSKSIDDKEVVKPSTTFTVLQTPLQSPNRFRNLRNMAMAADVDFSEIVDATGTHIPKLQFPETMSIKFKHKINNFVNIAKMLLGIDFLFGELPQANIQKCLANGYIIIWTSQGISDLLCAALTEDRYGIAQKDIPVFISTLVHLKQNLDKLNKVSSLTKRIGACDDFNYKMKGALIIAVRRSLFNICRTYKNHITDFPLSKDVLINLQSICKS